MGSVYEAIQALNVPIKTRIKVKFLTHSVYSEAKTGRELIWFYGKLNHVKKFE